MSKFELRQRTPAEVQSYLAGQILDRDTTIRQLKGWEDAMVETYERLGRVAMYSGHQGQGAWAKTIQRIIEELLLERGLEIKKGTNESIPNKPSGETEDDSAGQVEEEADCSEVPGFQGPG